MNFEEFKQQVMEDLPGALPERLSNVEIEPVSVTKLQHGKEEEEFEYMMSEELYEYAARLLMEAYVYAELCDIFPKFHKGTANITSMKSGYLSISEKKPIRYNSQMMEYYCLRKPLHYLLQCVCGKTTSFNEADRQMAIFDMYNEYWGENVWNDDYEPYTAVEGGGIRDYMMITAAKRYFLLYDADYKVRNLRCPRLH